jgi:hypothetical protein
VDMGETREAIDLNGRGGGIRTPRPSAPKFDSARNFNNLTGTVGALSTAI